jgi:hypothetical protein
MTIETDKGAVNNKLGEPTTGAKHEASCGGQVSWLAKRDRALKYHLLLSLASPSFSIVSLKSVGQTPCQPLPGFELSVLW